jgi:hypothetical protein
MVERLGGFEREDGIPYIHAHKGHAQHGIHEASKLVLWIRHIFAHEESKVGEYVSRERLGIDGTLW